MGSVAKQFEENGGYPKTLSGNPTTTPAYKGRSGLGDFTGKVSHFERPKEDLPRKVGAYGEPLEMNKGKCVL